MKLFYIVSLCVLALTGCSSSSDTETEAELIAEMESLPILKGQFVSAAHPTEGTVALNVKRTQININGLKSDEGPIMELYLATDLEATDFITLGAMQGFEGDFSYEIPNSDTIDFTKHKYLLVWCVEFSVNFGHAVLK